MRKTKFIFTLIAVLAATFLPFRASAQQSNVPQEVAEVFSTAASIDEFGVWSRVLDSDGMLLGYVAYSKPASDNIQGFNGETPLIVVFDAQKTIRKVALLDNDETPRFVTRVEENGFFEAWNGLSIEEALEKEVDAVSGATFTSNGVKQSLQACLKNIKMNMPSDGESCTNSCCCCTWCIVGVIVLIAIVVCSVLLVRRRRK
ncbi:MAG: FMN-binding protein [Bacteroidales bacterium]|nr:FMN-binding protein [Bacteroidales bacterium]